MSNRTFSTLNTIQSSTLVNSWRRARVLRFMGLKVYGEPVIREGCFFSSKRVLISNGCFVNHQCYFGAEDWIELGERVHLGPRVTFATATHKFGNAKCRAGMDVRKSITVQNGCWLGANVTVLSGVQIAEGCMIAAGSVVIRNTAPHGLYAGIPAQRIRDLSY